MFQTQLGFPEEYFKENLEKEVETCHAKLEELENVVPKTRKGF